MSKSAKSRLDELLVRRGLADSITTARAMIMSGDVIVGDQRIDKAGTTVDTSAEIRLRDEGRFVSRGGEKLDAAIIDFGLAENFQRKVILDVGASTGGFTDCVLSHGATHVYAVDVGTAQLAWKLRQDSRVTSIEKTDIKSFQPPDGITIDWVVADVSFTSLAKLIPDIRRAAPRASVLLLVKPQFELPREMIPDGGIVSDDDDRKLAVRHVRDALEGSGYTIKGEIDAKVAGKQGNREIFLWAE